MFIATANSSLIFLVYFWIFQVLEFKGALAPHENILYALSTFGIQAYWGQFFNESCSDLWETAASNILYVLYKKFKDEPLIPEHVVRSK